MRGNYIPVILLLFCFVNASGQTAIADRYPAELKRMESINADNSLTVIILENEKFLATANDGGGTLAGYFKDKKIQKITRTIGNSHGIEVYDYYFTNGKLFYIHEVFSLFNYDQKTESLDYKATEVNFIGRYYFANDVLIDSETTGHNRFEDDTIDIGSTLVREMKECLIKLTKN